MTSIWATLETELLARLGQEDDPELWQAVLSCVYPDADALAAEVGGHYQVVTEVGRCSHWLRPHQTRWKADGGFAWPTGYGGRRYSRWGLPQFDWSCAAVWDQMRRAWVQDPEPPRESSRVLLFRVSVPSRTTRHQQAAIHTVWLPGPPQHPRQSLVQFYGLRRTPDGWKQTAYDGGSKAYESLGRDS